MKDSSIAVLKNMGLIYDVCNFADCNEGWVNCRCKPETVSTCTHKNPCPFCHRGVLLTKEGLALLELLR